MMAAETIFLPCPKCEKPQEAVLFAAHLKNCSSRKEDQETRDAAYLAARAADADEKPVRTAYEERRFREDVRRIGLDAAIENDQARTAYRRGK